jgi:hypothetical protein
MMILVVAGIESAVISWNSAHLAVGYLELTGYLFKNNLISALAFSMSHFLPVSTTTSFHHKHDDGY